MILAFLDVLLVFSYYEPLERIFRCITKMMTCIECEQHFLLKLKTCH